MASLVSPDLVRLDRLRPRDALAPEGLPQANQVVRSVVQEDRVRVFSPFKVKCHQLEPSQGDAVLAKALLVPVLRRRALVVRVNQVPDQRVPSPQRPEQIVRVQRQEEMTGSQAVLPPMNLSWALLNLPGVEGNYQN